MKALAKNEFTIRPSLNMVVPISPVFIPQYQMRDTPTNPRTGLAAHHLSSLASARRWRRWTSPGTAHNDFNHLLSLSVTSLNFSRALRLTVCLRMRLFSLATTLNILLICKVLNPEIPGSMHPPSSTKTMDFQCKFYESPIFQSSNELGFFCNDGNHLPRSVTQHSLLYVPASGRDDAKHPISSRLR